MKLRNKHFIMRTCYISLWLNENRHQSIINNIHKYSKFELYFKKSMPSGSRKNRMSKRIRYKITCFILRLKLRKYV